MFLSCKLISLPVDINDFVPVVVGDEIHETHVVFRSDLDSVALNIVRRSVIQTLRKPGRDKRHLEGIGIRMQCVKRLRVHRAQESENASINLMKEKCEAELTVKKWHIWTYVPLSLIHI